MALATRESRGWGRPVLRVMAALLVAGIAAWASYRHMVHLAQSHGQPRDVAYLLPLSVDGMMVVAAGFIGTRPFAYVAFTVGIVASVVANALAAPPDLISRVISAWPALALLIVVELLRNPRRRRRDRVSLVQEVMKTGVETPHPTPAEPTVPAPVSMSTAPATQELPVYVDTIREIQDQMTQQLEPVPVIHDPKGAPDFAVMREPTPVPPVKVNGSNDASAKATDAEILNLTRQQVSGAEIARRVGKSLSTVRRTQAAARKAGEL